MQRIGIAASHIAKGNLLLYNIFVVLIAFLLALLILVVSGLVIVSGLVLLAALTSWRSIADFSQGVLSPIPLCLLFLSMFSALLCLYAIFFNMKWKR